MLINLIRLMTLALWVVILVDQFLPFSTPWTTWLDWIGVILLVAHFAEYLLFQQAIKSLQDRSIVAFLNTMIFGVFYWKFSHN